MSPADSYPDNTNDHENPGADFDSTKSTRRLGIDVVERLHDTFGENRDGALVVPAAE